MPKVHTPQAAKDFKEALQNITTQATTQAEAKQAQGTSTEQTGTPLPKR